MNLKDLLGDAYKEGMTEAEINECLASKKLVDITTGNYVSKEKAEREKQEALNKQTADYANEKAAAEKAQADLNEKISALEKEKNKSAFADKLKTHNIDARYADYLQNQYKLDDEKLDENLDKFAKENPAFCVDGKKVTFSNLGDGNKGEPQVSENLLGALEDYYKK